MKDHYLTVKQLKEVLKGLHPNTPVYYNRIQDVYFNKHHWKADLNIPDPDDPLGMPPHIDNDYIRAFTAFRCKDKKNKTCVCITAHY